jgi:uncharacterized protein YfkK (UPF0435 family)
MAGVVARGAISGFLEARAKMRENEKLAAATPFSIAGAVWDRDQVERFLQMVERIGECLEMIAKSQGIMSDNFQQSTQSKLNDLLEMIEKPKPKPRPRPRRKKPV